jgi:hypothetical protein
MEGNTEFIARNVALTEVEHGVFSREGQLCYERINAVTRWRVGILRASCLSPSAVLHACTQNNMRMKSTSSEF